MPYAQRMKSCRALTSISIRSLRKHCGMSEERSWTDRKELFVGGQTYNLEENDWGLRPPNLPAPWPLVHFRAPDPDSKTQRRGIRAPMADHTILFRSRGMSHVLPSRDISINIYWSEDMSCDTRHVFRSRDMAWLAIMRHVLRSRDMSCDHEPSCDHETCISLIIQGSRLSS